MNPKLLYNKYGVTPLCNVCFGNLHYLLEEDKSRLKGRIALYCVDCGIKHYGDVQAMEQWALDVKEGRKERPVKPAPPEPEAEEITPDAEASVDVHEVHE